MSKIWVLAATIMLNLGVLFSQSITPSSVCTLPGIINESSGIEKTGPNSFWTHNDSGGLPEIYNIDSSGTLIKTIAITNASNIDWEDVALGENGSFYIGDFGNNNNNRSAGNDPLTIYIIQNPDLIAGTTTTATSLVFDYEDRNLLAPSNNHNFDMEGFFFYNDSLHLFTKNRTSPSNGLIKHYVLPAQPGNYTAELVDSINNGGIRITSADMSPNHQTIALMANNRIFLVSCFENSRFLATGFMSSITIPNTQKEAIVFNTNSDVYLTDENTGGGTGKLYRANLNNYIAQPLTLVANITPTCPSTNAGEVLVTPAGGTPGYIYSWSNANTTAHNTNLDSGVYSLQITDNHGCQMDTVFEVPLHPVPAANASNTGPYCEGDTILLNCLGGIATYNWEGPGGYTQNNQQNPNIPQANTSMGGVYTVTVTNMFNCSATSTCTVIVAPLPTVTANNTGPYCEGETIFLNSISDSTSNDWAGPLGYVEYNVENPNILSATTGMNGLYTVTASSLSGCTASSTTLVIIHSLPVAPTILVSADTLFSNPAMGYTFQWYYNSNPLVGEVGSYLIGGATGNYLVEITDSNGCTAASFNYYFINNNGIPIFEASTMLVYPNPTHDSFIIQVPANVHAYTFEIYDLSGKKQMAGNQSTPGSIYLAGGMYHLLMNVADNIYHQVLVVE